MGTTFNFELNNKPSKNKTYAILLRITQDKKHTRKKTSIEVKRKNDFNQKAKQGNWIRTSEPNHKKWNSALEIELEEAKQAYRDLKKSGMATKELIKTKITSEEVSPSFLTYARQRATDIYNEGGYRNFKKYNGFCNKLEAYLEELHKKDIYFSEISTAFLSKFEAYLYSLKNVRNSEAKLHPNTISLTLRIFRTIINRAIEVDKIITPAANPFMGFKYVTPKYASKEKLTAEEIRKIEELELEEKSLIWNCRNYFMFSFYMAGIRAGDLIQLRWNNITSDGRLEYRMGKTKKDRSIKLHDKAKNILKYYYDEKCKPTDYIFPLLKNDAPYAKAVTNEQKETLPSGLIKKQTDDVSSKNALINKYLKKIASLAGIQKNISFHISRHSFSRIAKEKNVDNNHLKNILGHSNIVVTERYMGSFSTAETDAVMKSIFEEKPDPKEKVKEILKSINPDELEKIIAEIQKENY
ncbi:MAG: site-specific integrase [Prolixibacteraceae bacterium]|nr:site-specific integrase [Prolixibacteraceae bacterium]